MLVSARPPKQTGYVLSSIVIVGCSPFQLGALRGPEQISPSPRSARRTARSAASAAVRQSCRIPSCQNSSSLPGSGIRRAAVAIRLDVDRTQGMRVLTPLSIRTLPARVFAPVPPRLVADGTEASRSTLGVGIVV